MNHNLDGLGKKALRKKVEDLRWAVLLLAGTLCFYVLLKGD